MSRRLSVVLDLDSGSFTAKMGAAAGATGKLTGSLDSAAPAVDRIEKRMKGLVATTRDLTLILSQARTALYNIRTVATGWVEQIIKTNAEMERMTFLLANMSDKLSVAERFEEAGDSLDYLFSKAKSAPFSIGALTDSFVKMKSTGIDPTLSGMDGLTNAVAAFGGTDQTLHRASIAIQQMSGKGVISMEELRQQLGEAVPSAVRLLARSMDMSYGDLVDKIAKGQVEAGSALDKLFGEFNRTFGGSSQQMMETFSGKMAVAKTTLIELALAMGGFDREAGGFADGSFMDRLTQQLQGFIDLMNTPEVGVFAKDLSAALVTMLDLIQKVTSVAVQYKDVIIAAGKAFLFYFGTRLVVSTLVGIRTAVVSVGASFATMGAAARTAGSNLALINIAMTLFGQKAATGREVAVAMGQGISGLAGSFARLAGPIGIAIAIIYAAADAMGVFEDKAKKAAKAGDDFLDGFATKEGLKDTQKLIVSLEKDLKLLDARLVESKKNFDDVGDTDVRQYYQALVDARKKAADDLAFNQKQAAAMTRQIAGNEADKTSEFLVRQIRSETQTLKAAYDTQQRELDKKREDLAKRDGVSDAERAREEGVLRDRRLSFNKQYYDGQLAIYEKYIADLTAQGIKLRAGDVGGLQGAINFAPGTETAKAYDAVTKSIEKVVAARVELTNSALREGDVAASKPPELGGGDDKTDKVNPAITRLDQLRARAAELNAELAGTSGEVAKVNAQFVAWAREGVVVTEAQKKEMLELAAATDATSEAIKEKNKNERLQERITSEFERQTTYAQEMTSLLTGGYSDITAEAELFRLRLVQIANQMTEGKDAALAMVDATTSAFLQGRAAEYARELVDTTRELRIGLLEREEAAQAGFDADVQRVTTMIDLNQFEGAERIRMEKIVSDYIKARRDQLVRETESGFETMLRSWKDTTTAMDSAAQNWADNFVNALVEGKLSFKDFAKSILADIAKIIIRAQIANAIVSAIGSFGGGSSAGASAGANVRPAVHSAPKLHSGGVVGQNSSGSTKVHDAIFASAMRYHNGGIAGLKPNEVPTILERGERVLTAEQQRGMGGRSAPNVQVNIINEGGQAMEEKSRSSSFDGESYVIDIVTAAAGRPGKMRNALKEAGQS